MAISPVSSSSSATEKGDATWIVRAGPANGACVPFESANKSGPYLRHYNFTVYIASNGGSHAWDSTAWWSDDTRWAVAQPWS